MDETVYSDALMHTKMADGTVVTMLPITRYNNILSAPKLVSNMDNTGNAPILFHVDEVIEEV